MYNSNLNFFLMNLYQKIREKSSSSLLTTDLTTFDTQIILKNNLLEFFEQNKLSVNQFGYREGMSTILTICELYEESLLIQFSE